MIKPKSRLGRGLSSLMSSPASEGRSFTAPPPSVPAPIAPIMRELPPAAVALPSEVETIDGALFHVELAAIVPNPHQPRRQMNEASINELAMSLKSSGLIQPIVVRKVGDQYQLIAGERRWRAAKVAGLAIVPAIVRQVDSFQQAQLALVENIQRENLNAIDRAVAYRSLMTQLGLTQAELAGRLGEDRSSIANFVRILELPESVQAMVADGRLSMGHAKILAGINDPAEQQRLANMVITQALSVRNLERQVQEKPQSVPARTPTPASSAHVADLEKSIARQLGLRVQVRSAKKGRGRVILHYASLDQFDELMGRLGVQAEAM